MGQKQNLCATDKARIYLREFASEQITPKEQSDELPRMNTSKDKLFRPQYKDYFSQRGEPSLFSMDPRIIYYPPKTYFKNVNVPRAATKLRYVGTNFKAYSGIHQGAYTNLLGTVNKVCEEYG